MSKFSNLLRMIILLKSKGKMKSRELAEALEVDERMIRKYKDDLEMAGVYIESMLGINGGYVLRTTDSLIDLNVKEEEFVALQLASEQLKSQEFIYYEEFEELYHKINIVCKDKYKGIEGNQFFVKDLRAVNMEQERKISADINRAVIYSNKIKMEYFSLSSGISNRVIHPYAVLAYKGGIYVVAYCEKRKEILDFKTSRIKKYEVLDEKFEKVKDFSLKKYMILIFFRNHIKIIWKPHWTWYNITSR